MNKTIATILFAFFLSAHALAQKGVGIGTTDPDGSAVLDVVAAGTPRGILIPRLSTDDRLNIGAPAQGLMVYDLTLQKFCVYNSGWYIIDAMTRPATGTAITHTGNLTISGAINQTGNFTITGAINQTGTMTVAGNVNVSNNLTVTNNAQVSGTVTATNYTLNAVGNGPIPQGGIIMWSGTTAPTGWALCDGTNGTPDLRGRFVVGYTSTDVDYNAIGRTGGEKRHTLTIGEMPSHSHVINGETMQKEGTSTIQVKVLDTGLDPNHGAYTENTESTGGGAAHENRPPYYALAYIMKL